MIGGASFVGSPVVVRQRSYGAGDVVRKGGQLHLGQSGLIVGGRCQRLPFGGQRLIQRGPHLIESAAQIASSPRLCPHPPDPLQKPVHPASVVDASPQQVAQRVADGTGRQHILTDPVDRRPDVVRRGQRVGTTGPRPVPESAVRVAPFLIVSRAVSGHDQLES